MPTKKKTQLEKKSKDDLTTQQEAFVAEYVVHFDAKRAAKAAGYSEKSLSSIPSQLLSNPKVKNAISEALDQYALKHDVLKKRVLEQLSYIAFSDMTNYQEWSGDYSTLKDSKSLTRGQRAAIQQVKVTTVTKEDSVSHSVDLKLCSKEKALELLGRHLGMFTDKIEHKGAVPVLIDYGDGKQTYLGTKKEDE